MKKNRPKTNRQRQPESRPTHARGAATARLRLPRFSLNIQPEQAIRARKVLGMLVLVAGVFMLLAFVSHLFTGTADQSLMTGSSANAHEPARNVAGRLGAAVGFFFITRGFGYISLLLPVFVVGFGLAIFENRHWRTIWRAFPHFFLILYWASMSGDLLARMAAPAWRDMGGDIGNSLNDWLSFYVGLVGVGFLLVVALGAYLVLQFNWQMAFMGKLGSLQHFNWMPAPFKKRAAGPQAQATANSAASHVAATDTTPEGAKSPKPDKDGKEDGVIIAIRPIRPASGNFEAAGLAEAIGNEAPEPAVRRQPQTPLPKTEPLPAEPSPDWPADKTQPAFKLGGEVEFIIEETIKDSYAEPNSFAEPEHASSGANFTQTLPQPDPSLGFAVNVAHVGDGKFAKIIGAEDQETLEDVEVVADWEAYDPMKQLSNYAYPTLDLLRHHEPATDKSINREELEHNKNRIVKTLQDYKIDISSIKATVGPTVTLYEIVPAPGVRISKIKSLEDDIALNLSALGIRIIAPMPGKGTIGIEIPNSKPEIVGFRSVLATEKFKSTQAELPLAIGKTIANEVYIADLAKMPHVLVAGATQQGKSVGLNAIIASILYKKHPSQVKFVLIDPKKVELTLYQALENHFLAKLPGYEDAVITDTSQVLAVLQSLCVEMDGRYELLKTARVRNLLEYNAKFRQRRLNPAKGHRFMPYIILIIDELADLMMTAGKEVEMPLCRLAQLARAVGIHLVVATQRPSVNVITGIIKANFPARIAYRVTGKVDSRTILDSNGAEQLIGRGDMLFSQGADIIRLQTPFIDTPEVEAIVNAIALQPGYSAAYMLPEAPTPDADGAKDEVDFEDGQRDKLFDEAARLVVRHQLGSTSLIQRRMKLGYNRAGRIMDQLERAGIVGPTNGSKPREVLQLSEPELERYLTGLG